MAFSAGDVVLVPFPYRDRLAERARPGVVISAQEGPTGILHPEVLGRYQALGVQLFHTDRDGMVSFTTDGKRLRVETYLTKNAREIPVGPR